MSITVAKCLEISSSTTNCTIEKQMRSTKCLYKLFRFPVHRLNHHKDHKNRD